MKALFSALIPALAAGLFLASAAGPITPEDSTTAERWKTWRADLDYLYEEIEKPSTLKAIFKTKGIDWKAVKKEADKRMREHAKAFKKRKKNDAAAESIEFYGVLEFVIGQLRDTHAQLEADRAIVDGWRAAQPGRHDAGIEFLRGEHGLILVANTFAGRGSNSPLYGKGVRHEATYLESVDGVPAQEYFAERAREKYEEHGWQSTLGRAHVEAMNGLDIPEGEGIKLVFQTLDASEQAIERYLEAPASRRAKAFKSLKWKSKKISLRATECLETRNPRNFRFMNVKLPELSETVDDQVYYARLPSGYGFIRQFGVSGKSREAMEEACAALADCPGMILDMRLNGGGGESGVGAFHKTEGKWDKPLAVLMGPKAMSQAETEIWTLRDMREARTCNVRFFGERTAGSSGGKLQFALPSGFAKGQFVVRHWHGGRSTIEGVGIDPDEEVLQDLVELSRGIDSCIARAEAWLGSEAD